MAGTLAAKVRGPARVLQWLSAVKTAPGVDDALKIRAQLSAGESVVTESGHWLGQDGTELRSGADAAEGIIARQSQLERLTADLERAREQATDMETRISELLTARAELEKRVSQTQHSQQVTVNERAEWIAGGGAGHKARTSSAQESPPNGNRGGRKAIRTGTTAPS